jgi:hypothetical protein
MTAIVEDMPVVITKEVCEFELLLNKYDFEIIGRS